MKKRFRLPSYLGIPLLLFILFGPAGVVAYLSHSVVWLVVIPPAIVLLTLLSGPLLFRKRKVTPEEFADELERLLTPSNDRDYDWEATMAPSIADDRLDRLRISLDLPQFYTLASEKDKDELRAIIATLRKGEIPETVRPTHITYPNR